MTPLQLQLMERADKTLSFGCIIADKNHWSNSDEWEYLQVLGYREPVERGYSAMVYYQTDYASYTQKWEGVNHIFNERMDYRFKGKNEGGYRYQVIGHPYGFDRLLYLNAIIFGLDNENKEIQNIVAYCENNKFDPLLKPCIDRPEEGQKLVLDFLQTLPK